MPQFPESLDPKNVREREVEIEWRTISYRTIWMTALVIALIALGVVYFIYADKINPVIAKALGVGSKALAPPTIEQRQARFFNIDGNVRVKKANSTVWVAASLNLPLEKGDVIQCGSDGVARVSFADGSVYDMKSDTLVVVEENSSTSDSKTTNVSVQITSGEVDLSTTRFEGESQVKFANAVARIGQESRASVKSDPKTQVSQITMRKGSSEVLRGTERVVLGAFDQALIEGDRMTKRRVMQPPLPLIPSPAAAVIAEGDKPEVTFTWTPVPSAKSYRLRVSTSPIFASLAVDRRVTSTSVKVNTLPVGPSYYWVVTSLDDQGKEGQTSDALKFDLLKQGAKDEILLEIDSYIQQGNQIEIIGRTEPQARVMVNDQPVFAVQPDGSFKHFTQPLSPGANQITVTAQNSKGKIATRRKTVYIQ